MSELPTLPVSGAMALPVVGEPRERADAARNRDRILCAAARLFDENDVEDVSMDAIAAAAGVGKGTLFRRFGDRAGLLRSLLDEEETAFQDSVIRGDPPLGPGAPPAERLAAFGRARFAVLERHGKMVFAAEAGERGARFESPVYQFYRAHITSLVREADPSLDAEYVTEALLTPLAADVFMYQRRRVGLDFERVCAGYGQLAERLIG